jgi:hypothetical protein
LLAVVRLELREQSKSKFEVQVELSSRRQDIPAAQRMGIINTKRPCQEEMQIFKAVIVSRLSDGVAIMLLMRQIKDII